MALAFGAYMEMNPLLTFVKLIYIMVLLVSIKRFIEGGRCFDVDWNEFVALVSANQSMID